MENRRNYGHDSIIQTSKGKEKSNIKLIDIIKYHFDNALSKTKNFIFFLIALSALFALLVMFLQHFLSPENAQLGFNQWWSNFTKVLGIGSGDSWANRLVNFLFWAMGVIISGSVIGFIAKGISNVTENLKKGRSKIIINDHILILGWSNNIYALINELMNANSNIKNSNIVVLSHLENRKMQELISQNLPKKLLGNVITRNGDITNLKDLQLVNPGGARNIIILDQNSSKDLKAKLSIMAIYAFTANQSKTIIVKIDEKKSLDNFSNIRNINLIPVYDYEVLVKVCSQSIRQKGIGKVVLDFMDFEGNEIYYYEEPNLIGKTYIEAVMSFSNASVVGIFSYEGNVLLNPNQQLIIEKGDKLIVVAEDDDKIAFCSKIESFSIEIDEKNNEAVSEGNLLIIGMSRFANDVLRNYLPFKSQNQKIYLLFDESLITNKEDVTRLISDNQSVEVLNFSDCHSSLTEIIKSKEIDAALVLPYSEAFSNDEADATTLMKMLELNSHNIEEENYKVRVIAYLLDSGKADIASITETEELIISDNLSSLMMAQYSENPHLLPLFEDIFDADGAAINLIEASELIIPDNEYLFSDIVYNGILKGYSVFGVLKDSNNNESVLLNIPKNDKVVLSTNDKVIVIAK